MFDAIGSFLAHPLIVVLAGGLVAALVGQYLAALWQSQRSALDRKHQLISEMTEELSKLFSCANLAEVRRDSTKRGVVRSELVEPIQAWTVFADVFKAKLRAYYPSAGIDGLWETIHESAYTFAHLAGTFEVNGRQSHLKRLSNLLDLDNSRYPIDLDQLINRQTVIPGDEELETSFARSWRMTRLVIEDLRDEAAERILTSRMTGEASGSDLRDRFVDWFREAWRS